MIRKKAVKFRYKLCSISFCTEEYVHAYKLWPTNLKDLELFDGNKLPPPPPNNPIGTFDDSIGVCAAEDRFRVL